MSEWKKVKLGEVAEIFSGYAFKSSEMNKESGTPLIKIKNINNFGVSKNCDTYLNKDVDLNKYKRFKLQEIDFLVAMTGQGSVGRIGKMKSFTPNFYVNQRVAIVRPDRETCEPYYAYLSVATNERQDELFNKANGAGQPNISAKQIGELEINLPSLPTQHRIATILSRYDSMIENYQKQIKLLEEAAQRLYKEWFVDLHFPGHENTKIIDGVPEGWENMSITDVFDFKYGKILPTKDFVADGTIPVYGASKQIGRYTKANCFEPKVLVGSRGNAGFVHRTIENETYVTNNSFIVNPLKKYDYLKLPFIYESFRMLDFVAICTGAAQPQLTLNSIASLKYLVPAKNLIISYCDTTNSYFSKIAMAYKQIRTLTEARNRLLPKLMSGEINVE